MAKGVNKTKLDAMSPSNQLDPEVYNGKEFVIYDEYTAAALDASSVIDLPDLPLGAMVTDWIIDHAALGSGTTFKFGTYNDDDCFMADAASTSAAKKTYTGNGVASSLGYRCDAKASGTEKTKLKITLGAGGAATGSIKVMIKFTMKG